MPTVLRVVVGVVVGIVAGGVLMSGFEISGGREALAWLSSNAKVSIVGGLAAVGGALAY